MSLEFEQFDAQFGARIQGLDKNRAIDSQLVQDLARGLSEHGVLLMRGEEISPKRLVELGNAFGELEILPEPDKRHPEHPEIFDLTNVRKDGNVVDFEEPQAVFL